MYKPFLRPLKSSYLKSFLIAAVSLSNGYYLGAILFTTRRGVLEKSFFKINFIGVNFEAGNETREKIRSDFVAKQNDECSEKRVFFVPVAIF